MIYRRPLFLSTYPPEECGLATFTKDLADAVDIAVGSRVSQVAAIKKENSLIPDHPRVVQTIDNRNENAYRQAAAIVNRSSCDVVGLQHEFGLYPDEWGSRILDFTRRCQKPIITTFHTLLTKPDELPRRLIREIAAQSQGIVVMTHFAVRLLQEVYDVDHSEIRMIPHGVPAAPFERSESNKDIVGLAGKKVICTFGLISRGKGIEYMIRAMPAIVDRCPNAVYLIVGVTHPQVKRHEQEAYRESLQEMARALGVTDHVIFVNRYLTLDELLTQLKACDVFVTPYPGKDQIASGTMAYAMATVGAVVSTPYLYAREVLADDRGLLVPFADSHAMATAVLRFLTEPELLAQTRAKAYRYAQPMFWSNVGRQYLRFIDDAVNPNPATPPPALRSRISVATNLPRQIADI
jgi:glycosyltransferase involved in cell wall biosynthesis